jgi:predicted nucleic acid-binding protein
MNIGLDTSALVRIIAGEPLELAEKVARRLAEIQEEGGLCEVSDIAAFEAYYALQQFYGMTKGEVLGHLRRLSLTQGFKFSPIATAVLETPNLEKANPGFIDRIIAAEYQSRGLTTLSCEKSFNKLPLAEVVS